jgi:hypothetical protein
VQEAGGASRGFAAPSSLGGVPRAALEAQEGLSRGSPVAIHRVDFHTKKICFPGLQLMSSKKVKCRCRTHVAPKPVNDTSILFVHGIVSPFSHLCFSEARACKNGNDCYFALALWFIVYMRKSKDSHVSAKNYRRMRKSIY